MNPYVRFEEETEAEYRAAGRWYEDHRQDLGVEFFDAVDFMLGHASLQQTLRGLHESMRNLDQSRPACKPLAYKPLRGLRPVHKQAPARNGKSFLH